MTTSLSYLADRAPANQRFRSVATNTKYTFVLPCMHHLCPFQAVGGARERAALTADTHADTTQKYHKEKVPSFFLRRPAAADYTAVQSASWLTDTRRAVLFFASQGGRSMGGRVTSLSLPGYLSPAPATCRTDGERRG